MFESVCTAGPIQSAAALWETRGASNAELLGELKQDAHAQELLTLTRRDAELNRMTQPVPISAEALDAWLLSPRFAVAQDKPDGRVKIRPVDNFSWGAHAEGEQGKMSKKARKVRSVNGYTALNVKIRHDTLDDLVELMSEFKKTLHKVPGLFKVDIDAAFRRVPVRVQDRWACAVAFKCEEQV